MFSELQSRSETDAVACILPAARGGTLPGRLQTTFNQHQRRFHDESILLLEGDACESTYYVIDGWLALSKSLEDGRTMIIDFALPGDIVDPVSGDGTMSDVMIEALTEGTLAQMPYSGWHKMVEEWPDLNRFAHSTEAATRARWGERMLRLGKGTAEMRVAYALVELCIRIDSTNDSLVPAFHIPLTQQQLGDYVGLSSVHVCRTMRRLARKNVLSMADHMDIRVLDLEALTDLAGIDYDSLKCEIVPSGL